MAVQFATIDQLRDFQGLTPREERPSDVEEAKVYDAETARLNGLLKRASTRVKTAVRLARVAYATTGIPKQEGIASGFADATCAQAVWFEDNGDVSGAADQFDSVSLIGVAFSKRSGSSASEQTAAASRVSPESLEILSNLGIFTTAVRH